jgi:hypothetical protein
MHSSYFLFVMVITMFCYAVIKGRPSKLRQSNPEFCPEKVSRGLAGVLLWFPSAEIPQLGLIPHCECHLSFSFQVVFTVGFEYDVGFSPAFLCPFSC